MALLVGETTICVVAIVGGGWDPVESEAVIGWGGGPAAMDIVGGCRFGAWIAVFICDSGGARLVVG